MQVESVVPAVSSATQVTLAVREEGTHEFDCSATCICVGTLNTTTAAELDQKVPNEWDARHTVVAIGDKDGTIHLVNFESPVTEVKVLESLQQACCQHVFIRRLCGTVGNHAAIIDVNGLVVAYHMDQVVWKYQSTRTPIFMQPLSPPTSNTATGIIIGDSKGQVKCVSEHRLEWSVAVTPPFLPTPVMYLDCNGQLTSLAPQMSTQDASAASPSSLSCCAVFSMQNSSGIWMRTVVVATTAGYIVFIAGGQITVCMFSASPIVSVRFAFFGFDLVLSLTQH
jgi:hypothetical protein